MRSIWHGFYGKMWNWVEFSIDMLLRSLIVLTCKSIVFKRCLSESQDYNFTNFFKKYQQKKNLN